MQNIPNWTSLLNKPSTFPPSSHSHSISDVTGLAGELSDKARQINLEQAEGISATAWREVLGIDAKLDAASLLAIIAALPTTEPIATGALWLDNGHVSLSPGIPPTITDQPDAAAIDEGATATFSVTATNATAYQWQLDAGSGFANISGATSSSYTTPVRATSDSGDEYRCVVTGSGGSVTSSAAIITVAVFAQFGNVKTWTSDPTWVYSLTGADIADNGITSAIRIVGGTGFAQGFYTRSNFFANFGTPDGTRNMIRLSSAPAAANVAGGRMRVLYATPASPAGLIVFDGNSLTVGVSGIPYPSQAMLIGFDDRWDWRNFGVGGQTATNMTSDAVSQIDSLLGNAAHTRGRFLVAWEITNDLFFGGTATDAYNRFVSYCQARRAAGWKVIAMDVLPRSDTGTPPSFETSRQTVNGLLAANWSTFADAFISVASDNRIGDAGDETNLSFYTNDRVHLNQNGNTVVAEKIFPVVRSLL